MKGDQFIYWISSIILTSNSVFGTEFTFEIADNDEQCFFEVVKENVECRMDFQVKPSFSRNETSESNGTRSSSKCVKLTFLRMNYAKRYFIPKIVINSCWMQTNFEFNSTNILFHLDSEFLIFAGCRWR